MEFSRDTILVVLVVMVLAPLLADLTHKVRVPIVVAEIVAGIIVGPQVLDLAQPDALIGALSDFGLAFLFFMAGMEIDPRSMRGRPAALAARGWAASLALGMIAALALWSANGIGAPVLVGLALTTTSLGALVPILRDADLTDHRVRPAGARRAAPRASSGRSSRCRSSSPSPRASSGTPRCSSSSP